MSTLCSLPPPFVLFCWGGSAAPDTTLPELLKSPMIGSTVGPLPQVPDRREVVQCIPPDLGYKGIIITQIPDLWDSVASTTSRSRIRGKSYTIPQTPERRWEGVKEGPFSHRHADPWGIESYRAPHRSGSHLWGPTSLLVDSTRPAAADHEGMISTRPQNPDPGYSTRDVVKSSRIPQIPGRWDSVVSTRSWIGGRSDSYVSPRSRKQIWERVKQGQVSHRPADPWGILPGSPPIQICGRGGGGCLRLPSLPADVDPTTRRGHRDSHSHHHRDRSFFLLAGKGENHSREACLARIHGFGGQQDWRRAFPKSRWRPCRAPW